MILSNRIKIGEVRKVILSVIMRNLDVILWAMGSYWRFLSEEVNFVITYTILLLIPVSLSPSLSPPLPLSSFSQICIYWTISMHQALCIALATGIPEVNKKYALSSRFLQSMREDGDGDTHVQCFVKGIVIETQISRVEAQRECG